MTAARLSNAALGRLPASVTAPAYDRAAVTTGIVHLGIGAFHRAHQAVHVDDRLGAGETGWGIIAASLRSADTRDALAPQDGLYTLGIRSGDTTQLRVIGAISEVIVANEARQRLLAAMADQRTRIVSLTVTEKGYCRAAGTGLLDTGHPDIRHDLAHPHAPVSAPGLIVEALRLRREAGTAPFTVLCCDNLPANGRTVGRILSDLAALRDAGFGRFITDEVACPSTMVDRIVPATTDADRALVAAGIGLADAWPVMTEPFSQWVIEDRFVAGRPRFEDSGVEFVSDVAAHEKMKLRLLNGTHSTMAYLGQLAGFETIADVVAEPAFAGFIRDMMDHEIGPTIPGFSTSELDAYKSALMARYANTALRHRTAQIAMDGSQKIPQRLLGTLRERIAAGQPVMRIGVALAAFMRFLTGTGENGEALPVNDPLADRFVTASAEAGASGISRVDARDDANALAHRLANAMLAITGIFGDLGENPRARDAIILPLAALYLGGARQLIGSNTT